MSRDVHLQLLGEKSALERMLAETPVEDVLDRASLEARLRTVEQGLGESISVELAPARVRLTFAGRPVVESHGIFAEFAMKAVHGFSESVSAMAASLNTPLAAMGPIPNKDLHQLLITSTALGSFGFELEEQRTSQLSLEESSPVAQALDRTQSLLQGTLGTDDELADSAAEIDRRALEKVRAFLGVLADNEAICTVRFRDSMVRFRDVGQIRTSIERLSQENLREEVEELRGELQGVLPEARMFEFAIEGSPQVIRGRISPAIADADELNRGLHRSTIIKVMVTRVGNRRPRYLLLESPTVASRE